MLKKASVIIVSCVIAHSCAAQLSKTDKARAEEMWQMISNDIRKHYYDPKYHGIDLETKIRETKDNIDKSSSLNLALSQLAGALDSFNDSHLYFVPPSRPFRHDFGWRLQMVGDRCYVIHVRPGSDAESKGLKAGDQVLAINGFPATRTDLPKMMYVFNVLRPQPALRLTLRDQAGQERQLDVAAKMQQLKRTMDLTGESGGGADIWEVIREEENADRLGRARAFEMGEDLVVLKIPAFDFSESDIERMVKVARKHKTMILDLRDNPGGSVETLKWLVGGLFEHEVKIGDRVGRESPKPLTAKSKFKEVFTGKVIVLIDSHSASAAELLARVVQLEKRGTVIGDRSSGSVMEAKRYHYKLGIDSVIYYGAVITDADLIMSDGHSLEHNGVVPDELVLPAAEDIAAGKDPVLARAAEIAGVKLTSEKAGKIFPFEWPPQ